MSTRFTPVAAQRPARPARAARKPRRRPSLRLSRLLAWLLSSVLGSSFSLAHAQVAPGALPTGGQVVVGSGQLQQTANLLVIQQNSARLGLNWQSFNIGSAATVEFRQPGADSVALNRILGNSGSEIYGHLKANGQVFLVNPNGVLFAPGSSVNVGGLVASTLDLSQQDFADGRYLFNALPGNTGNVVNQGTLRANAGGYLALFGNKVDNQGEIAVDAGSVILASGRAATVSISGSGLISAVVAPGLQGAVRNSGSISVDGGTVTLTAQSAQDIAASLVNNSGVIRANTLVERNGEIWITGDNVSSTGKLSADAAAGNAGRISVLGGMADGSLAVGGTLSARALDGSGKGGQIETSAAHVNIAADTRVDTRGAAGVRGAQGTWTIDPTDFAVGAGGAALSTSGIGADTLAGNLATTNVTLATAAGGSQPGDLSVNAAVSWAADTTLTLTAARNVVLNASITATGNNAGLAINPAGSDASGSFVINTSGSVQPKVTLSGSAPTLRIGGQTYTVLQSIQALQALDTTSPAPGGLYALGVDIDASATAGWNSGAGFNPIGDELTYANTGRTFTGTLEGLGHSITGLTINRPNASYNGLFAAANNSSIRDLSLVGGSVTGGSYVGGVVGYASGSTSLVNVQSGLAVTATDATSIGVRAGGLVGQFTGANGAGISRSAVTGAVIGDTNSGFAQVGGVVGNVTAGTFSNVSASGAVSATARNNSGNSNFATGGLVGNMQAGTLDTVLAQGAVTGGGSTGGLVGATSGSGSISNARAEGNVSGTSNVGGLVGYFAMAGGLTDSQAQGTVTGGSYSGGLVGYLDGAGDLRNTRAQGNVSGTYSVGGLVGVARGAGGIVDSTATGNVSALANSDSVGGLVGDYQRGAGITGSRADGSVSGGNYTGGFLGYYYNNANVTLTGIANAATVSGTTNTGGFVGYNAGAAAITGVSTVANVIGTNNVGGLAGFTNGAVSNSSASGNVVGTDNVGGLVGYSGSAGNFTDVSATGNVAGSANGGSVGGLVGAKSGGALTRATASGNVAGGSYAGGLVGYIDGSGNFSNLSASGSVTGGSRAGGLFGYDGSSGSINTASATGNVIGGSYVGGLIGELASGGAVSNATAGGRVSGGSMGGGLVGYMYNSVGISDSRATGDVSAATYAGGLVGQIYVTGSGIVNSSAAGRVTGGYMVGGLVGYLVNTNVDHGTSSGSVLATSDSTVYAGGLLGYASNAQAGGLVSNSSATGTVFADAGGTFAGGLVGQMVAGGIAHGSATGNVTAQDSLNANSSGHAAGGLVGDFSGTSITSSTASGTVSGRYRAGGLAGSYSGTQTLQDVSASGNVTGVQSVGGLVGELNVAGVQNGSATGKVTATGSGANAGGLVGVSRSSYAGASVTDSHATGDVSGGNYAGGLVGFWQNYNYGGTASGISNSWASGKVSGSSYAGGLVGFYDGIYSNNGDQGIHASTASGDVSGAQVAGGLVGYFYGYGGIQDSMATGNVSGLSGASEHDLGGLVGRFNNANGTPGAGMIERSTASGNVGLASGATLGAGTLVYAGGLVGYLDANTTATLAVSDSYASGAVRLAGTVNNGNLRAGGLVGFADASVRRSYATGAVAATGGSARVAGGLVAQKATAATAADSYWATDSTGQATSAAGIGKTTAELTQAATFSGWDVATGGGSSQVWRLYVGNSTPLLRSFLQPLTLTLADASKTYDGTVSLGDAVWTAVPHPDRVLVGGIAADAGSYALNANNIYSVQTGYDLSVAGSATLTVNKRQLTTAGLAAGKVYDATLTAALMAGAQPGNLVVGEDLTFVPGSGFALQFTDKNAGLQKTVNIFGSYSYTDGSHGKASNYLLPTGNTTTADVTPAPLSAGSFTAATRAYDGSTVVAVSATASTLSGVLGSDDVHVNLATVTTGSVADKNVGSGKAVTVQGVQLTGADGGNYTLAGINGVRVDITPATATINGLAAQDRAYNASTNVSINTSGAFLSGIVAGDLVLPRTSGVSAQTADKNVGNGKALTFAGLGLRGPDAGNYTAVAGSTTVNISPYLLTIYANRTTGTDRVYDGTANAVVDIPTYQWYGGDAITLSTTSILFDSKNVALNSSGAATTKTITVSGISLGGADAGNYALQNTTTTTTGTITPKAVTVSGATTTNRAYDGTRDVAVSLTNVSVGVGAFVGGDDVGVSVPSTGSVVGQMADKNVGNGKAVTVPGLLLTGADATNYTLGSSGSGVTVNITPKNLTAAYTTFDRIYDGNTTVRVSASSADIVSGDAVTFYSAYYWGTTPYYYANFTGTGAKNVGSNKAVNIVYDALLGNDANNYTLVNAPSTTAPYLTSASVTPRTVTLAFDSNTKVYDGGTGASVTLNRYNSSVVDSDDLATAQTAFYTGTGAKNVGINKPISVSGITLSGADAFNYTVANTTATTTGTVTAKPVTLTGISAVDRAYDGTTAVAVNAGTVGANGFISGDTVAVALPGGGLHSGTVATRDVGTAKPVTVTGLSLSGADAANYSIDIVGSGITVNIGAKAITPVYSGLDRVYNGGVNASVLASLADILAGDTVVFSQQAVFTGTDARNAGSNKPVSISNIALGGASAANYTLTTTTATTTAGITPKALAVDYSGLSRVYDGIGDRIASVLGTSLGVLSGDDVTFTQTALFSGDGAAGTGKQVLVSGIALAGAQARNYSLLNTTATTTATVTPRALGITGVSAVNRAYDGTTTVGLVLNGGAVDFSNVIAGDVVSIVLPTGGAGGISTGTMADRNVGTNKAVAITGINIQGSSAANYTLAGGSGLTVTITPKAITASYVGLSKVYDGSVVAQVLGGSAGIYAIDAGLVSISALGTYSGSGGKNVGTGKAIAVTGGFLSGSARDNYALANPNGLATGSITPRSVTASYQAALTKVYDGTTAAPASGTVGNAVPGDSVALAQTATFSGADGKNVGTTKAISISGITLTGSDAGNYTLLTSTASTTGGITPRPITVSGLGNVVALDRTYDGTRVVSISVPSGVTLLPGSADILAGDVVGIAVPASGITTGTMANKNAGNGKAVLVDGLTLSGADAGNYAIAGTGGITVNITPKALTAVYSGNSRVYNGLATASANGSSLDILAGDSVVISGDGFFTTGKNVGTGKTISVTEARLSSTDAANYTLLNATGTTTGDITPLQVTAAYSGGYTRVYDGSTAALLTASNSFLFGDAVTLSQTAQFSGSGARNVGNGKAISVSNIALSGADAANYALTSTTASTTGSITPKPLGVLGLTGVTAADRVYNGTTTVAVAVQSSGPISVDPLGVIAGDNVAVTAPPNGTTTGTMVDKNVGSNKPVAVVGLQLTGTDAGNYSIAATSGVTVNITPLVLTASFTGIDRAYDGTSLASVLGHAAGIIGNDVLNITGSGVFTGGKNVGMNKAIGVTSVALAGDDAGNYMLDSNSGSATATITPKIVTATYTAADKVYDGLTAARVAGSFAAQQVIAGDVLGLGQATAVFNDKNAGINKTVLVSGITLTGADAGNYLLTGTTSSITASITPKPLHISGFSGLVAVDRVYDGTLLVSLAGSGGGNLGIDVSDVVAGDMVGVNPLNGGVSTGTMADKNVGSNKAVTVGGITLTGADAGNYMVASAAGLTVNITPKALTASYSVLGKVYDGTAAAQVVGSTAGLVAGDAVTIAGNGLYTAGKNVGSGKAVTFSGMALGGLDAGNYTLTNSSGSATGDIVPRLVTASFVGVDKVYDRTDAATVVATGAGFITGDAIGVQQSARFVNGVNVGNGLSVLVSGITLAGADAANYALTTTSATTTANITPRPLNISGLSGLVTAVDRVYDGTLNVQLVASGALTPQLGGVLAGDTVLVNALGTGGSAIGTMVDKNVGQNKAVAISGFTLSGADAGNYRITGTVGVTVNITPRPVVLFGLSGVDRVYDATTTVALDTSRAGITGVLAGDDLRVQASGATGNMADTHVGTNKAVTVAGVTLGGTDAANYTATGGNTASVNITARPLQVSASQLLTAAGEVDRRYDGTLLANMQLADDHIAGDTLTLSYGSALFENPHAATNKVVHLTGLTLGGASAGDYLLGNTGITSSGTIIPRPLTVAANVVTAYVGHLGDLQLSFGYGKMVGSESVVGVTYTPGAIPRGSRAGDRILVTPSAAVFSGNSQASDYSVSYAPGYVLVMPAPPLVGDVAGNAGAQVLQVQLDAAAVANALQEQGREDASLAQPTPTAGKRNPAPLRTAAANANLGIILNADSRLLTPPALQRLPLVSMDPQLQRLMQATTAAEPRASATPAQP